MSLMEDGIFHIALVHLTENTVIRRPENTMGEFYNYKGTESIILMATVDADYYFIYANVGCQGHISDGGVFRNTEFYRKLKNDDLYLSQDEALPGWTIPVPYTLVADDAFPLTRHNETLHNRFE
jgi:hypothetical protein